MAVRHRRGLSAATIGLALLLATAGPLSAGAPEWGPIRVVGSDTASRQSLARTTSGTTEYLHSLTSTFDGLFTHHLRGAWYRRTTSDGATWGKTKRLNRVSQRVDGASLAVAGRYVFTAWVRPADTGTARMLYVRRNTNHGRLHAWSDAMRLTSKKARIDAPSIAASGADVFVVYTNARTGAIRLRSSHDRGRTWAARTVGVSTAATDVGWSGHPIIVATGRDVAVFWVSNESGSVKVRMSRDAGAHWGSSATLGNGGSGAIPSATAGHGRIAVAASDGTTPGWYRLWADGTWEPAGVIPPRDLDPEPPSGYGRTPAIALRGASFVGVAHTVAYADLGGHSTLVWRESPNGGQDWLPDESISFPTEITINHTASIVWRTTGLHVQWNENLEGDPAARLRSRH